MSKSSLAADALKLTVSKFTTLAITFISAMLLARYLSLEEYGTFSQIMLMINLSLPLFMLGLPNSINYFLNTSDTNSERKKFLSNYYSFSFVISIVIGIFLIIIIPLSEVLFDNSTLDMYYFFLFLFPLAKIITSSLENVLINYNKYLLIFIYRISNGLSLLGIILIVILSEGRLIEYLKLLLFVELGFTLLFIIMLFKIVGYLRFELKKADIKKILKFSVPLGMASVVGTTNIQIDKLMIGTLTNTEILAVYTNSSREIPVIIIATSISAVLIPKIVKLIKSKNYIKVISLWGSASQLAFYFICFFSTILFVFAEDVISILYSEKYVSGTNVFRIYTLLLLLKFTYFGLILNSFGKTKYIFYSSVASLLINIILNYPFYLMFGIIGPAIATFISLLIIIIFQLNLSAKLINANLKSILPWSNLFNILVTNFLFGSIFYLVKEYISLEKYFGDIIEFLIISAIWSSLYVFWNLNKIKKLWLILKGVE